MQVKLGKHSWITEAEFQIRFIVDLALILAFELTHLKAWSWTRGLWVDTGDFWVSNTGVC